ncbi:MAG TPA: pilus assembly protein CpaE, partial [Planctomycetaceae bacterium]|nr:pilus assembly protein CpaE [Planctomycetaceae bacterium]
AALDLIAKIRQQLPNCSILVASTSQDGPLILQAMRNGAQEFLSIPLELEDFMSALDRVRHANASGDGEGEVRDSQVLTVAGVNGGVGSTSVAVNLASVLAQDKHNTVALIDLDL